MSSDLSPFPWYPARLVAPQTWSVSDSGSDVFYLVCGSQKALFIDVGFGFADLHALAKALLPTDLPLQVVNTHGHPDHAWGNWQFDEVFIGAGDLFLIQKPLPEKRRLEVIAGTRSKIPADWQVDEAFLNGWGTRHPAQIMAVREGSTFELGGRTLEVIELPGHTPGGICLLDRTNRLLFSGDGLHPGHIWLQLKESLPLRAYYQHLQQFDQRWKGSFYRILWGHSQDPAPAETVQAVLQGLEKILAHEVVGTNHRTFLGDSLRADFPGCTIVYDPQKLK